MWYGRARYGDIGELVGKTLTMIEGKAGDDILTFHTSDGDVYRMSHYQDCCEQVYIEDISGELYMLLGSPLVMAEEVSNFDDPGPLSDYAESYTWTYYKFATKDGYVTIRWYGSSNGYYSERVSFEKIKDGSVAKA